MKPHKYYKWELLVLLCLAYFLHQANRVIFGVVLPAIKTDLSLTNSQVGLLGTTLFLVLALMTPVAGYVGDVFNRKWVVIFSVMFRSVATILTGFSGGLAGMLFFRSIATASGESFYAPAAYPLLAAFHTKTRTIAMSIHQTFLYLAMMVTGVLAGFIAEQWGWRSAFIICGGAGILLGVLIVYRLRNASAESDAGHKEEKRRISPREALGVIFRTPTVLLIIFSIFAVVLQYNAYLVWAPSFLREKYSLSMAKAGGLAMTCLYLPSMAGVLVGGFVSDRLVALRPSFRLQLQSVSMFLCAPAVLLLAFAPSLWLTCSGMLALGLFQGMYQSNTPASIFDVIEPRYRSSAVGVEIMLTYLVGSTSPWIFGQLREAFGDVQGLSYGFASLSAMYLLGSLAVLAACMFTFKRDRYVEPSPGVLDQFPAPEAKTLDAIKHAEYAMNRQPGDGQSHGGQG